MTKIKNDTQKTLRRSSYEDSPFKKNIVGFII